MQEGQDILPGEFYMIDHYKIGVMEQPGDLPDLVIMQFFCDEGNIMLALPMLDFTRYQDFIKELFR